ncbi:MAG: gpW family head-tail joining protein [Pseudomonadota bacterium]
MSFTQDDLDNLNEAIAKLVAGERVVRVEHEGHSVKYGETDLNDLISLRDRMSAELKGKSKKRRIQIISNKGTC